MPPFMHAICSMRKGRVTQFLIVLMLCCFSVLLGACTIGPITLGPSTPKSQNSSTFPDPTTGTGSPPAAPVPLAQLPWCRYNTQHLRFWDYGGSASVTPTIVTDWAQIQGKLGFSIYLPAQLSADVCLTEVRGDLNSPQGNAFQITYDYYQRLYHNRLIILEQATTATGTNLQCGIPTTDALESVPDATYDRTSDPQPYLCKGQRSQTMITIQAPENIQQLTTDF